MDTKPLNKKDRRALERAARLATDAATPPRDGGVPPPVSDPAALAASPWGALIEPEVPANRHTGRYTGRAVQEGQNLLYRMNRDGFNSVAADGTVRLVHLTDYQLAILWAVEWPNAKCRFLDHVDYVASTRTAYVNGKHPIPDPRAEGCGSTYANDETGSVTKTPYRGPAAEPKK